MYTVPFLYLNGQICTFNLGTYNVPSEIEQNVSLYHPSDKAICTFLVQMCHFIILLIKYRSINDNKIKYTIVTHIFLNTQ